jgi:Domain of unknown function (DUF4275)
LNQWRWTCANRDREPKIAYFDDALNAAGGRREVIPTRRRHELLQEWRHVYARWLYITSGKWTYRSYDWHVFSYNHAPAVARDKAVITYASLSPPPHTVICPHDERLPALEILDGLLPDFRNSGLDIYVWPDSLDWTMAFTHEDGWFGPYFSRREWIRTPAR